MSSADTTGRRAPRLWIVETIVVLGIVAFGYVALTTDAPHWSDAPAAVDTNPITGLIR